MVVRNLYVILFCLQYFTRKVNSTDIILFIHLPGPQKSAYHVRLLLNVSVWYYTILLVIFFTLTLFYDLV